MRGNLRTVKNIFIGDRQFYRKVLMVAVPIMVQNAISTFVSLLDNVMVGRVGTEAMSGVSIVNQLIFIFNLCVFGSMSGAGIFGAQFYGDRNVEGHRQTVRFKLLLSVVLGVAGMSVLYFFGEDLIGLYLTGGDDGLDVALTLKEGYDYLKVAIWGLFPFALAFAYASSLRETSETLRPMLASLAAVTWNLVFNYFLIFGTFGFPEMGVRGAALATVMSRFVEAGILIAHSYRKKEKYPFFRGLFKNFHIDGGLLKQLIRKGLPLTMNETIWSVGVAFLTQCYSVRGIAVVAAVNISSTLNNVCSIVYQSNGNAISIVVGQLLGAGKFEEAKLWAKRMIAFSVEVAFVTLGVMCLLAPLFPHIYNTTDEVRAMATSLILVIGLTAPLGGMENACYFVIRSGGRTFITFLFDSMAVWLVNVPIAFILGRFTNLSIVRIMAAVYVSDIVKCTVGFIMVKKNIWVRKLVN